MQNAPSDKKEAPPSNHFAGGATPYGSRDLTNNHIIHLFIALLI